MQSLILREVSKMIIPFIQIFGLYVIFFGHISPGGGFSGGTILGVSLILYRIAHGKEKSMNKFKYNSLIHSLCGALIFYGILKGYSFITGASGVHFPQIPLGMPGNIFSGGYLLPLNIAVGIIVAVTVYFLFALFYEGEI